MDLNPYVETITQQLAAAAAAGGDEARALAERLIAPLDAAIRLALQDALAAATEEITCELAPGSVELRLRGRNPEFVVTAPPAGMSSDDIADGDHGGAQGGWGGALQATADGDDGGLARINLRMPIPLKGRVERAAESDGVSVNSWLVRATSAAVERADHGGRRRPGTAHSSQRYTGWAR